MDKPDIINYEINDPLELNLSYMPFIVNGGLFIPTPGSYAIDEPVTVDLKLPGQTSLLRITGRVVWITPRNALHHVLSGIGIQFIGPEASHVKDQIETHLDTSIQVGGYTYGITDTTRTDKK